METNIRVISFNVRYLESVSKRAKALSECVLSYRPDVIGFQEATPEWMDLLRMYLNEYQSVGTGREGLNKSEHSAIFYLNKNYSLVDSGNFWLSETPNNVSIGWDAKQARICTWAVLKDNETGGIFAHYNTHLDDIGTKSRVKGAKLITDRINQKGVPAILTGDLNEHENSEMYRTVIENGMDDTKYLAEESVAGGTYHNYGQIDVTTASPIDFIFISKGSFSVKRYNIIEDRASDNSFLSDHFGVLSDVRLCSKIA